MRRACLCVCVCALCVICDQLTTNGTFYAFYYIAFLGTFLFSFFHFFVSAWRCSVTIHVLCSMCIYMQGIYTYIRNVCVCMWYVCAFSFRCCIHACPIFFRQTATRLSPIKLAPRGGAVWRFPQFSELVVVCSFFLEKVVNLRRLFTKGKRTQWGLLDFLAPRPPPPPGNMTNDTAYIAGTQQ